MIKRKSKIIASIVMAILLIFGLAQNMVLADSTSITVMLSWARYSYDEDSGAYTAGRQYTLNTGSGHKIYQIVEVSSGSTVSTNYYCLNATVGDTWTNGTTSTAVTYTTSYDLIEDYEAIETLSDAYKNILDEEIYTQVLWILDNMYVREEGEVTGLTVDDILTAAGIEWSVIGTNTSGDYEYAYTYTGTNKWEYGSNGGYTYTDSDGNAVYVNLTEEEVEVAQQAALWYFTNYLTDYDSYADQFNVYTEAGSDGVYSCADDNPWLQYEDYDASDEYEATEFKMRREQIAILTNYFIDSANAAADENYESLTSEDFSIKIAYASDNGSASEDTSGNYVIGPLEITTTGDVTNISLTVATGEDYGTTISSDNITLQDSSGNTISSITADSEFYVVIPSDYIDGDVKITVSGEGIITTKTLLSTSSNNEQPIVKVEKTKVPVTDDLEVGEENFDLALRKVIMAVNGDTTISSENFDDASRTMNITTSTIESDGTATYNHRKDPIVVETGDVVTYRLYIYNEGDIAGYATKIVDQLADGLSMSSDVGETVTSYKGNEYVITYDEESNQITFTLSSDEPVSLAAYNTELDYDYIDIDCTVEQEAETNGETKHYLSNIAYIYEAYDSENSTIVEQDRSGTESSPSVYPDETSSDLNVTDEDDIYHGSTDLDIFDNGTNNDAYFAGEEDDDDFETVVVLPKEFDLALRKFITQVSSDGDFDNEDTTTYDREPVVDTSTIETTGTATYTHPKDTVEVEVGDYILYTIRVYNEGDIDGYVTEITDYLPEYLDFVDSSDEYINSINSNWTYDSSTRKVTTSQLSGTLLAAYDGGDTLSYADVYIICKVNSELSTSTVLTNIAEITGETDEDGNEMTDRDSTPDNLDYPEDPSTYKDDEIPTDEDDYYIPGQEDDDDFEKIIVYEKPDIHKGVKTVENQDSGYDADEEITWVIESDIPSNISTYKEYKIIDDIDYRLTYIEDSVIVTIGETTLTENTDYTLTYVENESGVEDKTSSGTLTITFIDSEGSISASETLLENAGGTITIEFKTNFATDEDGNLLAELGTEIENQAILEYQNSSGETKTQESETPEVHTGGVTLLKYYTDDDEEKVVLEGATFGIYETEEDATNGENEIQTAESDSDGIVRFIGLEYGEDASDSSENLTDSGTYEYDSTTLSTTYYVAEIEAPTGYEKSDEIITVVINSSSYEEDATAILYEVENVQLEFDLALLKYVTKVYVTEDGETTVTSTGNTGSDSDIIPKVEITEKKIDSTVVKFEFTIKITNEGDIAGYATEITDYVPEGLEFYEEDNEGWTDEGDNVISTTLLKDTLLEPGESATVTVILRWINGESNLGLKTNVAEISEDYNEEGVPDRDSTPDNQEDGEDDIDDAAVLLAIKTGIVDNIILFTIVGAISLVILVGGVTIIRKFVL